VEKNLVLRIHILLEFEINQSINQSMINHEIHLMGLDQSTLYSHCYFCSK